MPDQTPDVTKSVVVPATVAEAFAVFTERPLEWWPETHVFVRDRQGIAFEPPLGGRYYEWGADGTEIAWGTIVAWEPPHRVAMTWRVGPGWRPVFDDEHASVIDVRFVAVDGGTEVALTHAQLDRHGADAPRIHAALDGPSPGETLARFAETVARHVPATA